MADTYKSNADRQIMGLKNVYNPKNINILDTIQQRDTKLSDINFNIIPFPLDRLPKQLSDLYIYILDLKKELRSSILNNPEARKRIKTINKIDIALDKINEIILNDIVKELDYL